MFSIQVRLIDTLCEKIKDQISSNQKKVTNEIEEFDASLMERKAQLDKLRSRIHTLTRDSHITAKIKQKHGLTAEVIGTLDTALDSFEPTSAPELVINGWYFLQKLLLQYTRLLSRFLFLANK